MDDPTELQIWLLHSQLLVDIYDAVFPGQAPREPLTSKFGEKFTPGATLSVVADQNMAALESYLATLHGISQLDTVSAKEAEWKFYYGQIVKGANLAGTAQDLGPYLDRLETEIGMITAGLSAQARKAASPLRTNSANGTKLPFDASPLFWIFVIGFLNRKVCLAAEVLSEDPDAVMEVEIQRLGSYCLVPRLNSFDRVQMSLVGPFVEPAATGPERTAHFERARKNINGEKGAPWFYLPFSQVYHRVRDWRTNVPGDSVLGLDAGGRLKSPTEKSTLGRLRSKYHLPLRCDISGTTTDAMGFGGYMAKLFRSNQVAITDDDRRLALHHLLSCMISMCLTGHHSLDEMALAVGLWQGNKRYDPLDPTTVIDVLMGYCGWRDGDSSAYLDDGKREYYASKAKDILRIDPRASLPVDDAMWQALCHRPYDS